MTQKQEKTTRQKTGSKHKKKPAFTAAEAKRFKQLLLEKRKEIIGDVNEIENETLKKSRRVAAGDLSSVPIHMADVGTATYQQEFAIELMNGERKLLKEIDDALQRIGQRTYGICEGTGKLIAKARLEAKPWARYCVEYAQMLEQGLVPEPEID